MISHLASRCWINPGGPPIEELGDRDAIIARDVQRREALDQASHEHLAMFQPHFDLRPLRSQLTGQEWRDTDVLLQTPGPLLAAPLAWLDFSEEGASEPAPLFEVVASTSSVISLTMRHLAQQEARLPENRILAVHWEEPENRYRAGGMMRLQQHLKSCGQANHWEVWFMGDTPEATDANVRRALNSERRYGVLVVNAHGIRERYGVRLAQKSEWRGDGADLQHTDLIVLPACSVGRLSQDGSREVEGLYAELAAHHGRTVVAARWPIADTETAEFTHAFVAEYVAEVDQHVGDGPLKPFVRARALNRARRRLLAEGSVSFHLAAAFEMYGLG